jgi:hypothetical protein
MADTFLVQCPEADANDLAELRNSLTQKRAIEATGDFEPARVHPFDGQVMLEMVLPLTTAVLTVLRTWIRARYDHKKSTIIMQDGDLLIMQGVDPDKGLEIMQSRVKQQDDA